MTSPKALLEEIAQSEAELNAIEHAANRAKVYEFPDHPKVKTVTVSRLGEVFTVSITDKGDKFVTPMDLEEDCTEFMKQAFAKGPFGTMPVEGAASLVRGYRTESQDALFEAKLQNELDEGEINWYEDYAEPGYTKGTKGVLIANWNHFERDFTNWLEESYSIEWSDEWMPCQECNNLVRTTHDSYGWQLYGAIQHGGYTCGDCIKADPKPYLKSFEGVHKNAVSIRDIDPAKHGYILVTEQHSFENGWHPGQNDVPEDIALKMRALGITGFFFKLASVGQFDVRFDLYIPKADRRKLKKVKEQLHVK